jgi:hypothetical protein
MMPPAATPIPPATLFAGYRNGAWYGVDAGATVANSAKVADTAYGFPIILERATTIARIAMSVGTSVAGVNGKLALYSSLPNAPAWHRLLAGSETTYDMNAAANTNHVLVFATPLRLPRGIYWGVSRFSGAAQPRSAQTGLTQGQAGSVFHNLLGAAAANAVHSNVAASIVSRITAPLPFGDAWPATLPAPSYGANAPGSACIAWSPS